MAEKEVSLWSDGYAESLHLLEEGDEYPVAGYKDTLNEAYKQVRGCKGRKLLELGFGTGILTRKLYQDGYDIYGADYSESLVEAGKELMPKAHLLCEDYELGLPYEFLGETFDVAVITYALSKIDGIEKVELFEEIVKHLNPGGRLIVGDLAFESMAEMKDFWKKHKDQRIHYDFPLIHQEVRKDFPDARWMKMSKCAGILIIDK